MKRNKSNALPDVFQHQQRMLVSIILVAAVLSFLSGYLHIHAVSVTDTRHDQKQYALQFMDASDYLTSEVQAFVVTGLEEHRDNYFRELNTEKRREHSVEMLSHLELTAQEQQIIADMSALSDELVPLEIQSMEYAAAGDYEAAKDIVFGESYKGKIAQILSLRNQAVQLFDANASQRLWHLNLIAEITDLLTWLLSAAVVVIVFFQKKTLSRLAYLDPDTGLYNYTAFREIMRARKKVGGSGYVISADLRSFATINDTCGVTTGDRVIQEMARIFRNAQRPGELAAHILGDRFVLFFHSSSPEELVERLRQLRGEIKGLSATLEVPHLVPKFGICAVSDSDRPERSLGNANLAKHRLADMGDAFYVFFDDGIQQRRLANQRLEDKFETALRENQFEIWYQPLFSPVTGKPVSAEALTRWRDENGKLIPPGDFIPLFERNGMIARLDEHNFESVCAQIRGWLDEGLEVAPISVNVSRSSILYDRILERYTAIVEKYRIPTDYIKLELTESALVNGDQTSSVIQDFREKGFHILVDDFGSGYSSLHLLTEKYYDTIKIDKSLVDCIGTESGNFLLKSIINLAHDFHMTVTAEGVEEAAQVDFLKDLSCDSIQGFYYSRPLPASDFRELLLRS